MKLSILTATYNRDKFLLKLYDSILNNIELSNLEAEWIVIDDGSIDNTKKIVDKFILDRKFEIKYIYQENAGKMAAINRGMKEVTGELLVDCDSDDFFTDNAFSIIEKECIKLLQNPELYGMCFLKKDLKDNVSGNEFPSNYFKTTMFDLYFKQDIGGEKILVFNTSIRKKFKHELEKNEKFVTEARMYHKMDEKYKILCINEAIEIGDYVKDGYTRNISDTLKNIPMDITCILRRF